MSFVERASRILAPGVLLCAWLWHVARAATAAVTTDEAFTALDFAGKPWLQALTNYDANNHALHTVLVKLALDTFGWHTAALRLPTLLAAILYLWLIWRLGMRWFGATPAFVAFCVIAGWSPPIAEYFSLARGYGLAVAFFTWAVYEAEPAGVSRWHRVSLAMGLSVAANLVFVVPCAALTLVLCLRERAWGDLRRLFAPAFVTALIANAIPLSRAEGGHFYYGAGTWHESLLSIVYVVGFDNVTTGLAILLPLTSLFAFRLQASRWLAWTTLVSFLIVALLALGGVPLPRGRTGVYLALLLILTVCRALLNIPHAAWLGVILAPLSWAALPLRFHPEWHFDASSRTIVERIAVERRSTKPLVIAAEFPLNYAVAFHAREILGAGAQVVRKDQPSVAAQFIVTSTEPPPGRVLYRDPSTSATLSEIAVPSAR